VHLAADLGCRYISMKARGGGGPYNPFDHPPFSFLDDLSLRRRMIAAMSQRGVSISLGEGFVVQPGTDLLDDRASLDLMSEFGVTRANAVTMDPDLNRSFDQFAAFAEAAAQRGSGSDLPGRLQRPSRSWRRSARPARHREPLRGNGAPGCGSA